MLLIHLKTFCIYFVNTKPLLKENTIELLNKNNLKSENFSYFIQDIVFLSGSYGLYLSVFNIATFYSSLLPIIETKMES